MSEAPTSMTSPRTQFFNWQRFSALVRVDLAARWRSYAGLLLTAFVVLVLLMIWTLVSSNQIRPYDADSQLFWYYLPMIGFGIAFAVLFYAPLEKHAACLLYLMRPASIFEKWLHAALVLLVLFPLAYLVVFELAMIPRNALAASIESARIAEALLQQPTDLNAPSLQAIGFVLFVPLLPLNYQASDIFTPQFIFLWMYVILTAHAAFALVRFHRAAAIKAAGLALVVLIISLALLSSFSFGSRFGAVLLLSVTDTPPTVGAKQILANLLFWLLTPLLAWISSYLVLRERDLT